MDNIENSCHESITKRELIHSPASIKHRQLFFTLRVFTECKLDPSNRKSPQLFRPFLSMLTIIDSVVFWTVSILPAYYFTWPPSSGLLQGRLILSLSLSCPDAFLRVFFFSYLLRFSFSFTFSLSITFWLTSLTSPLLHGVAIPARVEYMD